MTTSNINTRYPAIVWGFAIFLAPLLMVLNFYSTSVAKWDLSYVILYFMLVLIEVILSFPTIFLYRVAYKELIECDVSETAIKSMLSTLVLFGLVFTFWILDFIAGFNFSTESLIPFTIYFLVIVIVSFIVRIKSNNKEYLVG